MTRNTCLETLVKAVWPLLQRAPEKVRIRCIIEFQIQQQQRINVEKLNAIAVLFSDKLL